jgi:hypothetical protein
MRKPIVDDILKANKVVKYIKDEPEECLTFLSEALKWPEKPGDEIEIVTASVSDASHGQEDEYLEEEDVREPFRSHGAKLIFLANKEMLTQECAHLHLISFGSTVVRKVCSSTLKAETYQLQTVVESGDLLRAAVADMHGQLDYKHWETSASKFMVHVWFTDCNSTAETLKKPVPKKGVDKRIGMELAALRQCLWRRKGDGLADPRLYDAMPEDPTDICHWIDTHSMIADPLTKRMKADLLVQVLKTNFWSWKQTEEAKADKLRRQGHRQTARHKKNAAKEGGAKGSDDHDPWHAQDKGNDSDPEHTEEATAQLSYVRPGPTLKRPSEYEGVPRSDTRSMQMATRLPPIRLCTGALGKEPGSRM